MDGRDLRRNMTLSDQLAAPEAPLRDFLMVRDDGDGDGGGRTLMDIIRDGDSDDGSNGANWKPLKDRIRLRRAGAEWPTPSSSTDGPAPDQDPDVRRPPPPAFSRSISRTVSIRQAPPAFSRATSTRVAPGAAARAAQESANADEAAAAALDTEVEGEEEEEQQQLPVRMSLMALLEQTDSQWRGGDGIDAALEEEDEEEEVEDDDGGGGEMFHVCCVCMVRHKGAAFIPCGHTFCRLCSRELWVSRGNCPLCNGFIQEILDIF